MSVWTRPQKCPRLLGRRSLARQSLSSQLLWGALLQPGPASCGLDLGEAPLLFPLAGNPTRAFLLLSPRATSEGRWLSPPVHGRSEPSTS